MFAEEFRDPSRETNKRVPDDNDTASEASKGQSVPWQVGDQFGPFALEKELGEGSSGVVFRARDALSDRVCALKMLRRTTPEELMRSKLGFRRMVSMRHPSLLSVYQIHRRGEQTALSMEEIVGNTFSVATQGLRSGRVEAAYDTLLRWTRQFGAGLAAMHFKGLLHRDIKPKNLMVDARGDARIIDYGLVGTFDPEADPSGFRPYLVGTLHFFAPETLWNQSYLPAGDIFSLGMVILEAMQRIASWEAGDLRPLKRNQQNAAEDAEAIHNAVGELDASAPGILRGICCEMLQPDPADRPQAIEISRLGLSTSVRVSWPIDEPVVGRESELQAIRQWLDGIFSGGVGRLHLTGPSGIGKSRLLDQIEQQIRTHTWIQVFRARCQPREDQPLQAFDQLCDAIANRYNQSDRSALLLDPVSTTLLHGTFPVLRSIVRCNLDLAPAARSTERLDALEAAARMSLALRKQGPLILIIDDTQWADRDSLNVLDRLATEVGDAGLGIITTSREQVDRQLTPATLELSLNPLSPADSVSLLSMAAAGRGVTPDPELLQQLAQAAEGCPFRLQELADEFGPGGALVNAQARQSAQALTSAGAIDWLWQTRVARLTDDARQVLPYIVAARCPVSVRQLAQLTSLGDSVDAAVSELAHQRLVNDDATGGECIEIIHDRVSAGLEKTLGADVLRSAHRAWASCLVRADDQKKLAARIALHLFDAKEPWRAVSYAMLAAEEAEQVLAKTDAARWHARVIPYVNGREKVSHIRQAARCFAEADRPADAAHYFRMLSQYVGFEEQIHCQRMAVTLLIRSGEYDQVRFQMHGLAEMLGLPRPSSVLWSRLSLAIGGCWDAVTKREAISLEALKSNAEASGGAGASPDDRAAPVPSSSVPAPTSGKEARNRRRLDLCLSLIRPLSMFDNLYSAQLSRLSAHLVANHGNHSEQIHVLVGQSVFGCYDRGTRRQQAEETLDELKSIAEATGHPRASGDVWSGIAYMHALNCRWAQVPKAVDRSVAYYRQIAGASGFELAHTRWLEIWSHWNTGQWDAMFSVCDEMFEDAVRRNDLFQRTVVCRGLGCTAWLARDREQEWQRIYLDDGEFKANASAQMLGVFDRISAIQRDIFSGNYAQAWQEWRALDAMIRKLPFRWIQMLRVLRESLGALIALHRLQQSLPLAGRPLGKQTRDWSDRVQRRVRRLFHEQLPNATMLGNYYSGLLHQRLATHGACDEQIARDYLEAASFEARGLELRPFQLAADDLLAKLSTGRTLGLLRERMHSKGVLRPRDLERLYALPPDY